MTKTLNRSAPSKLRAIGYSSGNFGKAILSSTIDLFFIFYLTDMLGLAPKAAGLLIMLALAWDAMLDPIVATIADRTYTRIGKYGPYLLVGAPLCATSFLLLFNLPQINLSDSPWMALLFMMVFRTAYTLIDLPHNALLARAFEDSRARSGVASLRFFFSTVAKLSISVATIFILTPANKAQQIENFSFFSYLAAFLSVLFMWMSWLSVARQDIHENHMRAAQRPQSVRIKVILGNRDAVVLIALAFASALTLPVLEKSISYYGKYVIGNAHSIGPGYIALVVGQMAFLPLWAWLSQQFDKAHALGIAHLAIICAVTLLLALAPVTLSLLLPLLVLVGIGTGGVYSIIWGMAPDVVDALEMHHKGRPEAALFALLVVAMKIGVALGSGTLGALLELIGYQPNQSATEEVIAGLTLVMCLAPMAGSLACIVLLRNYRIGHNAHRAILRRLQHQAGNKGFAKPLQE